MKRAIWGILILMVLLLGRPQASEAITLKYLSGGVMAGTTLNERNQHQNGLKYAYASDQLSGIGNAEASAHAGATNSGGYAVHFITQAEVLKSNYDAMAYGGTDGFILLQVTASPGDVGNSFQISYHSAFRTCINVPHWQPFPFRMVITLNGETKVNQYPDTDGLLDVAIGDIIGFSFYIFSDNLSITGGRPVGNMLATLCASLKPFPIPSHVPSSVPKAAIMLLLD